MSQAIESKVRHRIAGNHGRDMGSVRDAECVLCRAAVGGSEGADAARKPGLFADPFGGIEAVVNVVTNRDPAALGPVASANVLHDDHVAVRCKRLRVVGRGVFVVGGSSKQRGELFVGARRAVNVGRELHAVPHRDHHVLRHFDVVGLLCVNANYEENRGKQHFASIAILCI